MAIDARAKKLPLSLACACGICVALFFGVSGARAAADAVPRDLGFGSFGADVTTLQRILNLDSETRVAETGPGSPGRETNYFGVATRAAVSRFQRKYTADTLVPAGLRSPTGFAGVFTRRKLNSLSLSSGAAQLPAPPSAGAPSKTRNIPPSETAPRVNTSAQNPNLKNLDLYLASVADLERARGLDQKTIEEHASVIRQYAATSTDFMELFKEEFRKNLVEDSDSPRGRFLSVLKIMLQPLMDVFAPSASAVAVVGVPFGGPILYVFPCSCPPGIFSLGVGPPSTAPILNYAIGTQAFLSYNLPAARFLLGSYTPGVESCWQFAVLGCFPIPAAGQIAPMVGSSPL